MSRAIIKAVIDASQNQYTLTIPNLGDVSGQLITGDFMPVGTEIVIADIDNESPSVNKQHGAIRFLPNTNPNYTYTSETPNYNYNTANIWKTAQELWNTDNRAQLAKAYILSSKRNPRWQKEYPLYKKGKVTEIIDEKYMRVDILGDMARKCRTDYMTCDVAAFTIDDVVIIYYENGSYDKPVVIGFWGDPKVCRTWATDVFLSDNPGGTGCCPTPTGNESEFHITNIEWYTNTWQSFFSPTYYNNAGSENVASWDGNKYILYGNASSNCTNRFWAESVPDFTQWLNDNRPTMIRITFVAAINSSLKKIANPMMQIYNDDFSIVYEPVINTYEACITGYQTLNEISLNWNGIPDFSNAAIISGSSW